MSLFNKRLSKKEFNDVIAENNRLKFENEDLKRTVNNLKEKLDKVDSRIQLLQTQLNEKQMYIDKYHVEVIKDADKWAEHQAIDKKFGGKKK